MEEWVARRINSAHVLKPCLPTQERHYLYVATEFIDGQTLSQWMIDHPKPALETMRGIVEQITGAEVAKIKTQAAQRKLRYASVLHDEHETPAWLDSVLSKAVHINPYKRYESLSEFVYDLRHPNTEFLSQTRPPLAERHPVLFWKLVSAILATMVLLLVFARFGIQPGQI